MKREASRVATAYVEDYETPVVAPFAGTEEGFVTRRTEAMSGCVERIRGAGLAWTGPRTRPAPTAEADDAKSICGVRNFTVVRGDA
mmetsp:Transcript_41852/g.129338  ORF Transcript_41852/g.129338 Transcript_41852/m.129338 type:complete len:86 (-) Transcript_41852:42-299(-)|eukprot:CAMPEP_0174853258 /NCGR_PEP_ID=MMETSP1114-20130205/27684_1 /TAXON_ID=312471 /ORGANISM="Neobodo designis, Strain CCAP 1951/1" /LENGTH=85 /DNA_ID=CAMNT_0016087889 /DNA_START=102 /DNA_END=359 /DNA_ORIENTATION=-